MATLLQPARVSFVISSEPGPNFVDWIFLAIGCFLVETITSLDLATWTASQTKNLHKRETIAGSSWKTLEGVL